MSVRGTLERALEGVEGWLFLDEACGLYEAVHGLPVGAVNAVEIGSWKGRSAIALGLAVKARALGRVFAIDPHTHEDLPVPVETVDEFRVNVARAGVEPFVELLVMTSQAARPRFADGSVDFLFIDGSHEYPDAKWDIKEWTSALKDHAGIAINDPWWPGVYRALCELVLRPGPYLHPRLVINTLFFDFERAAIWGSADSKALRRLRLVLWLKFHAVPLWRFMPTWLVRAARYVSTRILTAQ